MLIVPQLRNQRSTARRYSGLFLLTEMSSLATPIREVPAPEIGMADSTRLFCSYNWFS
jgi:hypothetical protein